MTAAVTDIELCFRMDDFPLGCFSAFAPQMIVAKRHLRHLLVAIKRELLIT
jgi:hypothetical protein